MSQSGLKVLIYTAHAMSAFGDRLWQFALPIVLVFLFPASLLMPSIFMLVHNLLKIVLVPALGREIVRHDRLLVVSIATALQCMCLACSMALLMWWDPLDLGHLEGGTAANRQERSTLSQMVGTSSAVTHALYSAVVLSVILGSLGDVASTVSTIATEKDWVVAIAKDMAATHPNERDPLLADGNNITPSHVGRSSPTEHEVLLLLNSNMRQIDLICKIIAPASLGALLVVFADSTRTQIVVACVCVIGWQLVTVVPTCLLWKAVYDRIPGLAEMHEAPESVCAADGSTNGSADLTVENYYLKSPLLLASLSYVFLYLTVLSDHNMLTLAYLVGPGQCSPILAATMHVGAALSGLLGAAFWQWQGTSLARKGGWFILAFWICVCIAGLSILLGKPPGSSYVLIIALVASRFSLWTFDLTINTLIQTELHPPIHRPLFTALQTALCKGFETLMAVCAVAAAFAFAGTQAYAVLVYMSMGAITTSVVLFCLWEWTADGGTAQAGEDQDLSERKGA